MNDKKNGNGNMTYANGDLYHGEWMNDKRNGNGNSILFQQFIHEKNRHDSILPSPQSFSFYNRVKHTYRQPLQVWYVRMYIIRLAINTRYKEHLQINRQTLLVLSPSNMPYISPSSPREFSVSPFRHTTTTFFPSFLYIDRLFFSKDRSWLKPLLLRTWKHKSALNLHILLFHCYKNFSDFQDIKLRSALNRHILLLHYYKEFWDFQGTFMWGCSIQTFFLFLLICSIYCSAYILIT